MISSYVGENELFANQYMDGTIELEFTPQGTLAEKMRSGAYGIPAFFTRTGLGTYIEEGGMITKYKKDGTPDIISKPKPKMTFNGLEYIMEETVRPDFSIIKGHIADTLGNVVFNKTAWNFNMDAAKCGKTCIVEVEKIVPAGEIKPEHVHLPHIFVKRIIKGENYVKPIEKMTVRKLDGSMETQF